MFINILLVTACVLGSIWIIQVSIPLIGYLIMGAYFALEWVVKKTAGLITGRGDIVLNSQPA